MLVQECEEKLQRMDQGLAYLQKIKKAVQKDKDSHEAIQSHRRKLAAQADKENPCKRLCSVSEPSDKSSSNLEPPSLQILFPASTQERKGPASQRSMASLLDALYKSPLGEFLGAERTKGVELEILLKEILTSGSLKTVVEIEGNKWINEILVQALVEIVIVCADQEIVWGAFEILQMIFTEKNKGVVPGSKEFTELLRRLGYKREGCAVNWEQQEELRVKDGVAKFESPVTTGRIHLVLKLIPAVFKINNKVLVSRTRTHSLVELVCTLVHLALNVSWQYYESELGLALAEIFTGINEDVANAILIDIVDILLELGPSHRAHVRMIKFDWGETSSVRALRQLWCVSVLQKISPSQAFAKHFQNSPSAILEYLIEYLDSPFVLIEHYSGSGTNEQPAVVDWWLLVSILEILEELLILFIRSDPKEMLHENQGIVRVVWEKFRAEMTKFTRGNSCHRSVGYSHLRFQLSALRTRWDEKVTP